MQLSISIYCDGDNQPAGLDRILNSWKATWDEQYAAFANLEFVTKENLKLAKTQNSLPSALREIIAIRNPDIYFAEISHGIESIEAGEHPFVEAVIANLEHFQSIPLNTPEDADKFLTNELRGKGMIWKIFTLHILNPDKYPIFDQHVYRAMVYLKTGEIKEIPESNEEKQLKYINEYLHFYNEEHKHFEDRKLDKALFSFGQFLKTRWGNRGTENSQCSAITERGKA